MQHWRKRMAIYRTGQASMDAQGYITGYDTKWREQLTLIRPGATIVFLTQPLQIAVITEVINDTSIRAITTGGAVVTRSNYAILLHDSITVDGLAQDVAETLRYYQSKETEIADAIEFFRDFDLEGLKDLVNQVKQGAESAKQSAAAAKTSETNSKASETNAKASENAANASKNAAKNSQDAALASQNAAKTSETNAKNSENSANASKSEAARSASDALDSKNAAKASEDKAKEYADSINPANILNKNNNLSDVEDKGEARKNLSVDRLLQGNDVNGETVVSSADGTKRIFVKNNGDWGMWDSTSKSDVALPINKGGTGAKNAPGARKNLDAPGLNVSNTFVGSQLFKGSQDAVKIQRSSDESSSGCWTVYLSADGQPGFRAGFYGPNYAIYSYRNNSALIKRCMLLTPGGDVSFGGEIIGNNVVAGSSVEARGNGKRAVLRTWPNDVSVSNSVSNKFLQLRDNGEIAYDNKLIAYNGLAASGTFAMTVPSIKVTTANGGFRIDGTASTNNQPLHVTGYNSAGTRLWFLGKDTGTSALFLNDITSSKVELHTDGVVLGTKNFAGKAYIQASSLEIDRPSGKYFKMLNDGNSSNPATFSLWGNGNDRPSVIEWSFDNGPGWGFYCQLNKDNSKYLQVNGHVNATAFNQASDRDLKDNIEEIENATESLRKMSGYTYTLKENGLPYAGVIAQEVMEAIPEAVGGFTQYTDLAGPTKDGNQLVGEERFLSVDYGAVTGLLVKVCRESDDRISKLEKEVAELKAVVSALINKPTTLES
ncbi:tail fiber protein [Escherichia phage Henu8]|uniref:Tail fiber protein n=1 Tax=Escherichia phage Henu8 TaxID=2596677 RepID=A0A5B8RMD2_9CAUD|nr:tail fiber protein [Escherichia phage Henu8]QEA10100.1 tail fiber protein [Escherichia phage Henu8]